jgi:hypothetical protein
MDRHDSIGLFQMQVRLAGREVPIQPGAWITRELLGKSITIEQFEKSRDRQFN